jgi:hypothetical protein
MKEVFMTMWIGKGDDEKVSATTQLGEEVTKDILINFDQVQYPSHLYLYSYVYYWLLHLHACLFLYIS